MWWANQCSANLEYLLLRSAIKSEPPPLQIQIVCLNYSWHILRLKKADSTKGNTTLSHLLILRLKKNSTPLINSAWKHTSCIMSSTYGVTKDNWSKETIFNKIEMCKYRNSFYFWIYFPFLDFLLFSWLVSFEVTYFLDECNIIFFFLP